MDKQMRMGGMAQVKEADECVHEIASKIRDEVERNAGQKFPEFTAITAKTQLVNGVNYYIKIRVDNGQYIHVRAYKSFGDDIHYSSHQENKTLDEEIIFFDN